MRSVHVAPPGPKAYEDFKRLPLAPNLREAYGFFRTVAGKRQIAEAREEFLRVSRERDVPNGEALFEKLIDHTRIIDLPTFRMGLNNLYRSLHTFLGEDRYIFYRSKEGRSEDFVFDLLRRCGLRQYFARNYIRTQDYEGRWIKHVVLDDVAYSGAQLTENVLDPLRNAGIPPERIFVGAVGMARTAFGKVQKRSGYIYTGVRMPDWRDPFSLEEREALERVLQMDQCGLDFGFGSPWMRNLTTPWYKMADNFLFADPRSVGLLYKGGFNRPLGNPLHSPSYRVLADIISAARLLW